MIELRSIKKVVAGLFGKNQKGVGKSYDHAGRVKQIFHQVNSNPQVLLSSIEYNEIGQAVTKRLHSTDNGTTFKQVVDQRYNIRGWLTRINNSDLTPDNSTDPRDYYGMSVSYNDVISGINNTPQYNGNVSSVRWSNNQGFGNITERAYKFAHDPLNRLLSATHMEKTTSWNASTSFNENNLSYDQNGNILTLSRNGANGSNQDILTYNYGTGSAQSNQLLSVSDAGDQQQGFVDGTIANVEYTYDANANMITDPNRGVASITYNHLNLVQKATKTTGEYIQFVYDAKGNLLSDSEYNSSNVLQKKTDYVGDFYYENDTLKSINHEEGRIVMTGATPEYQYHFHDQLKNIRATFTSKNDQDVSTATYETANVTTEQSKFLRYDDARRINSTLFDHTHNGVTSYSERLNGSSNEKYGIAKSLSVMPGDTIKMEVYVKYVDGSNPNNTAALTQLLAQIAAGTAAAGTVIDGANYSTNGITPFPYAGLSGTSNSTGAGPKAYMNWLAFDRNYVFKNGGFIRMSTTPKEDGSNVPHEKLSISFTVTEPGYVYLYLSNENDTPVEVYFDDWKITQVKNPVVQTDDYMPFGLTYNSYQREGTLANNWKFQGMKQVKSLNLGWSQFKYRNALPDLGRFFNNDPLADKYPYNSTYAFSENHVTSHVELEGLEKVSIHSASFAPYNIFGGVFVGDGANRSFGTNPKASSRISGSVDLNLSGSGITKTGSSRQGSFSINAAFGTGSESKANLTSGVSGEHSNGTSAMADVDFHLSGNNSQVPGSSDIDTKGQMQVGVVEMGEEGSMATFSGQITGDKFPANETYVTDQNGTGVFLGVSGADPGKGGNEHTGPFTQLPGDNNRSMSKFTIGIKFDSKGNIKSVMVGGKSFTPQDWNKQFQKKDPKDKNTSTTSQ
jgi:hypothetical protein